MPTVRDKLWMWGHKAGAHGPDSTWKLPKASRITPVEAAVYMGVPNMHMVWLWSEKEPEPQPSWAQYALPLRAMRQVVWGISHGNGLSFTDHILPLAASSPNVTGLILDDLFTPQADGRITAITQADLDMLDRRRHQPDRTLDLWAVVYEQDLDKPIAPVLARMDVLAFFAWNSPSIPHLERHLTALDALAGDKPKLMGLYMWDYPQRQPMPMALVEQQCDIALRLLKQGRIEGIIFVATCICDLELEAVEWTRRWIAEVGNEAV